MRALFNFLKLGLDNGEAGAYVATDENRSQIREAMKRFDIEVEKYEKTFALQIFGEEDIYIADEKFNVATTINLWNKLYNEALTRGFKELRVTGDTACFFKNTLTQN